MKYVTKTLLLTLAASVIVGCDRREAPAATPETSVTISGSAAKGIIQNGIVNFYGYTNGVKNTTSICSTTTSSSGAYSCTIKGYVGPLFAGISTNTSTRMTCDIPEGCGGSVAFGGNYTPTSSFSLSSIISSVSDGVGVTANVTPLTHLAAARAESALASLGSSTSTAQVSAAITEASKKVAILFFDSVDVNIQTLPIVDITNPTAVAAVTNENALKGAMISAAIVSTAISGSTVEAALNAVKTEFVANSGTLKGDSTTGIDLAGILDKAQTTITTVNNSLVTANVTSSIINAVQASIDVAEIVAVNTGNTTVDTTVPAVITDKTAKAKAFVNDLRDVFTALGDRRFDDATDGKNAEEYLAICDALLGGKFDSITNALEDAAKEVALSGNTVDIMSGDVRIMLTATGTEASGTSTGMTLSGVSLTSGGLTATTTSGSSAGTLKFTNVTAGGDAALIGYDDLALTMTDGTNTFTGTLTYTLTNYVEESSFGKRSVNLRGTFSNGTNSFVSSVALTLDGTTVDTSAEEESSSSFFDYSFTTVLIANLEGVDANATLTLSGDRTDFTTGTATMMVSYSGKTLTAKTTGTIANLDFNATGDTITITGGDVVFTGTRNASGFGLGNITVGGVQEAAVTQSSGAHLVTYSDGTFETLE